MFVPAPIDGKYVPSTKRTALRRNAALFVSSRSRAVTAARVIPQSASCARKKTCTPCAISPDGSQVLYCLGGECVGTNADCPS